jgi:hypothetical protein
MEDPAVVPRTVGWWTSKMVAGDEVPMPTIPVVIVSLPPLEVH